MRTCDPNSAFFGYMGIAASSIFSNLGAAFGTAKSGVGVCSVGVMRPDLVMKSILPVIMSGVLGIYGIIMSILIKGRISIDTYSTYLGYAHLSSGLIVGLSSLAAGLAIGIVGDAGVRANAQQNRLFMGLILILIFSEALALYGLIIGIYITMSDTPALCESYIK
ncbi:V-type proton ATPase 16 kDa proteolipid subunit, putative [Plasmodium gallinaceum]|uniref:V-type proton ATPase proteolipid subunit n=1 Tax=Plasmodium gallinaceum TaxID=5849 RepID=A0A1J1GPM3_PLAGA|nr:V-type proton ATPase 16 kDa proteolipid subunit, putative [Plasmodium gallinaceum]CRG92962.1 V-type proton ATPase 16 kDa proteolipid subunit, putative [Plasmodium gallinaceum]